MLKMKLKVVTGLSLVIKNVTSEDGDTKKGEK